MYSLSSIAVLSVLDLNMVNNKEISKLPITQSVVPVLNNKCLPHKHIWKEPFTNTAVSRISSPSTLPGAQHQSILKFAIHSLNFVWIGRNVTHGWPRWHNLASQSLVEKLSIRQKTVRWTLTSANQMQTLWMFSNSTAAASGLNKEKWTDSYIHTNEADGENLPTGTLYSNSGTLLGQNTQLLIDKRFPAA